MGPRGRGRGGPRGGRGGGNFRGRGRGGGGGRGRGRGRGNNFSGGQSSRLDMTRLEEEESSGDEVSDDEPPSEDEDEEMEDSDSEGEEEQSNQANRPYMALLQGFTDDNERNAKRRKLDNGAAATQQTATQTATQTASTQNDDDDEEDDEETDPAQIDEPEEEVDVDVEELLDSDDEDEEDDSDPFDNHFSQTTDGPVAAKVQAIQKSGWASKRTMAKASKAVLMRPDDGDSKATLPSSVKGPDDLKLKQKLKDVVSRKMATFDSLQQTLAPMVFNYQDILYPERNVRNADSLRQLVCLHAVNHVLKTRDRVMKNNTKLSKDNDTELEFRDQGFTRPKVLFILPTRQSCAKAVRVIEDLIEPDQKENSKRFEDSYVNEAQKFRDQKTDDFLDLFDGNDDDMFRLGVKFTRKTIKYFAQFYNSDILMASPLGLRMAIGSEEEKGKVDYDFLSSIELVVMDQADGLLMQNWEHVEFIFEHLNLQPKDAHDCDFSRVRTWYLEDWSKHFRQTIMLSPFVTPELSELMRTQCHNWAGKVRFHPEYPGLLQQLPVKARQTFSRFDCKSIDKDPDARFAYFTSAIVPSLVKRAKELTGTLIFVPSYFDFVRLRNYFATNSTVETLSFGNISEYSDATEAARGRSHFLSGRHKVLLYTERAHHFRRYKLRGVQRVIMYGLPENPIFYREIAGDYLAKAEQDNKLEPGQGSVRVMFSKYDVMKLERVVGTKRVGKMIQDRGDTFDFV